MIDYKIHKEFYNQPIRLVEEWKNDPYLYVKEFCGNHSLYFVRQTLADWFESALIAGNTECSAIEDIHALLRFYHDLESLAEAAYLINKKRGNKNITE